MSFIIVRKAAEGTWEPIGPRMSEWSERDAKKHLYTLQSKWPHIKFAAARIELTTNLEQSVSVVAASSEPEAPTRLREIQNG